MEAKMKKGVSITLLSIISVILAFLLAMTFARFPIGASKQFNGVLGAIEYDFGMEQNSVFTLKLDKDSDHPEDVREVLDVLTYRLNALGYENSSVKAVKDKSSNVYDIRIEVNANRNEYDKLDTDTLSADINTVAAYGKVEFFGANSSNPTDELFKDIDNPIESVEFSGYDATSASYLVALKFTKDAYSELLTNMRAGDFYFKITLGDQVILGGSEGGIISESYFQNRTIALVSSTEAGAKQMVLQITSGGLDYKYEISDVETASSVMANVGFVSIIAISAIIVLAAVAFAVFYKGYGLVSFISSLAFILVDILMYIAIPSIKLSIASVIGIALATIIAIDGQIVVIKRVSEEYSAGKTIKSAIRTGFKRALIPTITTGVVSGLTALSLFFIAKGAVKSFAASLGIGVVIATIVSLLLVRLLIAIFLPLCKDKQAFFNFKREDK